MAVEPRAMHMELRTGEVLQLPGGVELRLQFKKGQTARFLVSSPPGTDVKKVHKAAPQGAPSRAF